MPETHYRACNLCEAICGLAIEHEGGKILSIKGDPDDPFSKGHICPKAVALQDVHEDPDRVRRPLVKKGSDFVETSWEDAFDRAAHGIHAVQKKHGRDAVAIYGGNPIIHNYGAMLWGHILLPSVLRTKNRFSSQSIDALPRVLASYLLYGHQAVLPIPDVDRTDHFLILGANPLVSNGSVMTAPGMDRRIRAIKERGGKVVVIDPRRTETARVASEHHFIRPGTDAFLLLAMLATLFEEKLANPGRLVKLVSGLDRLEALARRFPPERVAAITGMGSSDIRRIAREFARARSAVCYGRLGVSVQEFGTLANVLCDVLNIVTGNVDREGGAMFSSPVVDLIGFASAVGQRGHLGKFKSRVRGLPEFSDELPVACMAEEMDTPGDGQVRALVTAFGNPVLSTPNGPRLERALAKLDFMVSIDIYVNETTRHAQVILPTTASLEHDHYDIVFNAIAVRNVTRYSPPLFAPAPGALHDWQVYAGLISRLVEGGVLGGALGRITSLFGKGATPERLLDLFVRLGPRGDRYLGRGFNLARIKEAPHGLDLGPLEPGRFEKLIYTKDRRVQLVPPEIASDVERLERRLQEAPQGLLLIGRRDIRTNNSWMHNSHRLVKGRDRCTLLVHPDDAKERGLVEGGSARVTSRVGSLVAKVEVTDDVARGVVSLPHGWGHAREGVKLKVAQENPGVSVNDVTDEAFVDALSGNASVTGLPVSIAPA